MALFGIGKDTEKKAEKAVPPKEAAAKAPETKEAPQAEKKPVAPKKQAASGSGQNFAYILKNPRITEKATFASEGGAYVFDVAADATKDQIARAVRTYYKVTPRKVNVVTIPSKRVRSRMRGRFGVVSGGKKAYVYLKKGDSIEIV